MNVNDVIQMMVKPNISKITKKEKKVAEEKNTPVRFHSSVSLLALLEFLIRLEVLRLSN